MNSIYLAVVLYQYISISSGLIKHIDDDKSALNVYEKVFNLIENITIRHGVNTKLWMISRQYSTDSAYFHNPIYDNNKITKIIYTVDYQLNTPDRRDYAAVYLAQTNDNRLENWLNMSLKQPADTIKIYVNHNDCHLNESMLAGVMRRLWQSHDNIAFIYYISLCTSGQRNSSVNRQSHRNNYIINLFYYHPFIRHKSVTEELNSQQNWGRMVKMSLINEEGWTDVSNQAFHYFPFVPHKLNFHGYLLTIILFPSTMAYFRSDINMFRKYLSMETLKDPFHNVGAYFGEDVEALLELQRRLNFAIRLSPTSDMGFYGFKVSNMAHIWQDST